MMIRRVLPPALVMIVGAALVACAAALLLMAASAEEARAAFPGNNGRIAFVGAPDGGTPSVYAISPDGSGVRRVVASVPSVAGAPVSVKDGASPEYSPDGSKIAFSRSDGHDHEVFVKDLAGGSVAQLTDNQTYQDPYDPSVGYPIHDYYPAFSPDGSKVAFMRYRKDSTEGALFFLCVMNADGSGQREIAYARYGDNPEWSPDGSEIALSTYGDGSSEIIVVDADSGDVVRIPSRGPVASTPYDYDPDWSPDGGRLLYVSSDLSAETSSGNDVWVMDADGANKTRLTDSARFESSPKWSPDGRKVAFVRTATTDPRSARDVWVMNADGSGQKNITDSPEDEGSLEWGPACPSCPDDTDPTITGPRPAPGSHIRDRTPTVRATVRDGVSDLARADVRLYIDGARRSFSYDPETDRLTRTTGRLSYGGHRVRIEATDAAGNEATRAWSFRVVRGR